MPDYQEGVDALVLDVKVGSGAFMKTRAQARKLAEAMVAAGRVWLAARTENDELADTQAQKLELTKLGLQEPTTLGCHVDKGASHSEAVLGQARAPGAAIPAGSW